MLDISWFELLAGVVVLGTGLLLPLLYWEKVVNFQFIAWGNLAAIVIGSLTLDRLTAQEPSASSVLLLSSLVALSAGVLVRRAVWGSRLEGGTYLELPSIPPNLLNRATLGLLVAVSITIVLAFFVRSGIPALADNVNEAKVTALADYGFVVIRFLRVMLPLLVLQVTIAQLARGRVVSPTQVALVGTCGVLSFFTGFKGYFVYFFVLPLLVVYSVFGFLTVKRALAIGILSLPVLAVYAGFVEHTGFLDGLLFVVNRVTVTNALGPFVITNQLVPEHGWYLGETFLWDLGAFLARLHLIQFDHQNFAAYVFTFANKTNPLNQQVATTVPAEAYANFGPIAMIAAVAAFGALLDYLSLMTERLSPDPVLMPYVIVVGVTLAGFFGTGPILYNTLDLILSLTVMGGIYYLTYATWSLLAGRLRLRKWQMRI